MIQNITKKRPEKPNKEVYANEFDENLIPNEGWVRETNQRITDSILGVWDDTKNMVAHFFQGSKKGITTIDTATIGFYAGGPKGAVAAAAVERGYACLNCHVTEHVSNTLEGGVDFITAPEDSIKSE